MAVRYAVRMTPEAEGDLEAIHAYIADHQSIDRAGELIADMYGVMATLSEFPLRGAIPKELEVVGRGRYRQVHLSPYRIMYRVIETTVFVVLIVDGRRDLPELLARRLLGR